MEVMKRVGCLTLIFFLAACSKGEPTGTSELPSKPEGKTEVATKEPKKTYSGPFGTEMGISADALQKAIGASPEHRDDYFYMYRSAPNPHPGFSQYAYVVSSTHGLCKLSAYSDVSTNRYGMELRSKFEELRDALATKYGTPTDGMDRVMRGSIWNDPEDFMMALSKGERHLNSIWSASKLELPNDLATILIEASADNGVSGIGQIRVAYEYKNFERCAEEFKKKENSAL